MDMPRSSRPRSATSAHSAYSAPPMPAQRQASFSTQDAAAYIEAATALVRPAPPSSVQTPFPSGRGLPPPGLSLRRWRRILQR